MIPPRADRRPLERVHHGDVFADPYEWLRDKDNPEVIGYLEAENAYTAEQTGHLDPLVDAVFDEIKTRTQETDLSVPGYATHDDGSAYWYYTRTLEGSEYPIHCRVPGDGPYEPARCDPGDRRRAGAARRQRRGPGERVLLPRRLQRLPQRPSAGLLGRSDRGRALHPAGPRDRRRGPAPDRIEDTGYGVAWARDDYLFYTRHDEAWRPYVVLRHRLGDDSGEDATVLTEDDERFWLGVVRQPRRALDDPRCRQQDHLRMLAARCRRSRGHAAQRRAPADRRRVRRRAGR